MMGAGSAALLLVVAAALAGVASAGDNVHQDDDAPKIPGCSNDFMLNSNGMMLRLTSTRRVFRNLLLDGRKIPDYASSNTCVLIDGKRAATHVFCSLISCLNWNVRLD